MFVALLIREQKQTSLRTRRNSLPPSKVSSYISCQLTMEAKTTATSAAPSLYLLFTSTTTGPSFLRGKRESKPGDFGSLGDLWL